MSLETSDRSCLLSSVLALCFVMGISCGQGLRLSEEPRPDLLIVTVDTARADRFSFMGSNLVPTPNLDILAAEGAIFEQASAPSPLTLVSHSTIFTGRNPPSHAVHDNGIFTLPDVEVTLAEILERKGYSTAAFVSAAVLSRTYGLAQGFEAYDDTVETVEGSPWAVMSRRRGESTAHAALDWLQQQSEAPVFLWVHLFDPHAPYLPPEPYRSSYPGRPYDALIAYVDQVVGNLVAEMETLRGNRDLLLVFTSDHGESLSQHGEETHAILLYEPVIHVPLFLRGAEIPPGRRVPSSVGLTDIVPTVLDYLGLESPAKVEGRSLMPELRGGSVADDRAVYMETYHPYYSYGWRWLRGLRSGRWKYIEGVDRELYDLENDPAETRNLALQSSALVEEFRDQLVRAHGAGRPASELPSRLDGQSLEELAALGYLSGAGVVASLEQAETTDPREKVPLLSQAQEAVYRFHEGEWDQAISRMQELVESEPNSPAFANYLADMYRRSRRFEEEAEVLAQILAFAPHTETLQKRYCRALEDAGRREETLSCYAELLGTDPEDELAQSRRWELLRATGQKDVLVRELKAAVAEDPGNGIAVVELLRLQLEDEPLSTLADALHEAQSGDPSDPAIAAEMGRIALQAGNVTDAEAQFRLVLEQVPNDRDALLVVGRVLLLRGDLAAAMELFTKGADSHPEEAAFFIEIARTSLRASDLRRASETLEIASRLDPDHPELWIVQGERALKLDRRDEALESFQKALELGADSARVQEYLVGPPPPR